MHAVSPHVERDLSHPTAMKSSASISYNSSNHYRPTEAQLRWAQFHHKKDAASVRKKIEKMLLHPVLVIDDCCDKNNDDSDTDSDYEHDKLSNGCDVLNHAVQQVGNITNSTVFVSSGRRALLKKSKRLFKQRSEHVKKFGFRHSIETNSNFVTGVGVPGQISSRSKAFDLSHNSDTSSADNCRQEQNSTLTGSSDNSKVTNYNFIKSRASLDGGGYVGDDLKFVRRVGALKNPTPFVGGGQTPLDRGASWVHKMYLPQSIQASSMKRSLTHNNVVDDGYKIPMNESPPQIHNSLVNENRQQYATSQYVKHFEEKINHTNLKRTSIHHETSKCQKLNMTGYHTNPDCNDTDAAETPSSIAATTTTASSEDFFFVQNMLCGYENTIEDDDEKSQTSENEFLFQRKRSQCIENEAKETDPMIVHVPGETLDIVDNTRTLVCVEDINKDINLVPNVIYTVDINLMEHNKTVMHLVNGPDTSPSNPSVIESCITEFLVKPIGLESNCQMIEDNVNKSEEDQQDSSSEHRSIYKAYQLENDGIINRNKQVSDTNIQRSTLPDDETVIVSQLCSCPTVSLGIFDCKLMENQEHRDNLPSNDCTGSDTRQVRCHIARDALESSSKPTNLTPIDRQIGESLSTTENIFLQEKTAHANEAGVRNSTDDDDSNYIQETGSLLVGNSVIYSKEIDDTKSSEEGLCSDQHSICVDRQEGGIMGERQTDYMTETDAADKSNYGSSIQVDVKQFYATRTANFSTKANASRTSEKVYTRSTKQEVRDFVQSYVQPSSTRRAVSKIVECNPLWEKRFMM